MITATKFEALGQSEEPVEEATELEPLFSRGKAIAYRFWRGEMGTLRFCPSI